MIYSNDLGFDPTQYCVLGIRKRGSSATSLVFDKENRLVVFDNLLTAQDFIPLMKEFPTLGIDETSITRWNKNGDLAWFSAPDGSLLLHNMTERVGIYGWDVYNVPAGLNLPHIHSETKQIDWKYHVIWSEWLQKLRYI